MGGADGLGLAVATSWQMECLRSGSGARLLRWAAESRAIQTVVTQTAPAAQVGPDPMTGDYVSSRHCWRRP
jgi:hypothetical protein